MIGRRLVYAAALSGVFLFWLSYPGWYSGYLLALMLAAPWLSLALSIRAMRKAAVQVSAPACCQRGRQAQLTVCCSGPACCRITLCIQETRVRLLLGSGAAHCFPLDTQHCGTARCQLVQARVYDYLGLFSRRLPDCTQTVTLVTPIPAAPDPLPPLPSSQNPEADHAPREFRPGDRLHSIHQKLSAKTGRLIVCPQEQAACTAALTLDWGGTAAQTDTCLDRLVWLSEQLLAAQQTHTVFWQDGTPRSAQISDRAALSRLIQALLLALPAPAQAAAPVPPPQSSWHCHIDGIKKENACA